MVDAFLVHVFVHCQLCEVYLIHMTFREMSVLPSSGDCCHYTDIFRVITVNIQHRTRQVCNARLVR
jgi:hypothetical protein